jgi:hypothetical protein
MLRVARNNKAHTIALPPPKVVLQPADLFAVITAAAHMPIPQDVRDAVGKLYAQLGDKGIIISDRRWEQSLDLLRAHAVLEQRTGLGHITLVIPGKKFLPSAGRRGFCSTPQKGKIRLRGGASYRFSELIENIRF